MQEYLKYISDVNFLYYMLAVNFLAFVFSEINIWISKKSDHRHLNGFIILFSILGGAYGALIHLLIFERKYTKKNMMPFVISVCFSVIYLILILLLQGYKGKPLNFDFGAYLIKRPVLILYLGFINIVTLATFAKDKVASFEEKSRIRILTLLFFCFIGGAFAGIIAMYSLRHKTRVNYFTIGVPLILFVQFLILFYYMNI